MRIKPREYENAPEGPCRAVCVDSVDLGFVDGTYGKKEKVKLVFETEHESEKTPGRRLTVSARFTASIHPKSSLSKFVKSWTGRAPSSDAEFDTEKLVGIPAQLMLEHNEYQGKTFVNITAIGKAGKDPLKPSGDYVRAAEREGGAGKEEDGGSPPDGDDIPF